jgi:hypothetical protein
MKLLLMAVAIDLLAVAVAAQDQPAADTQMGTARSRPWSVSMSLSNVFESNIDRDEDSLDTYGVVLGTDLSYRNNPTRPTFALRYNVAAHSYSHTNRWDRISQFLHVSTERRLSSRWRLEAAGEISLKGSSEDFELTDQYSFRPRLEHRLSGRDRVRLYAAYRLRRYGEEDGRNAVNTYVGAEFQQLFEEGRRWTIGLRYEQNDPVARRHQFRRWTYGTEQTIPLGRRDLLTLQVNYRWKHYGHRLVKVEGTRVPRLNQKWEPSLIWERDLGGGLALQLGYARESQTSNDPERGYTADQLIFSVARRW